MTGGSSGTGLCLALLLAKKGAHVSIVARNEDNLQKALQTIQVRGLGYHLPQTLTIPLGCSANIGADHQVVLLLVNDF